MAVGTAGTPTTDYGAVFRSYIVKNTGDILALVKRAGPILTDAEREQALHSLSYALEWPVAWPQASALLIAMAPKMEQAGFRDEWLPYLERGLRQSQALDDLESEAELQFQLGRVYRLRGKFARARAHFEASEAGFRRLDSPRNQARAMTRLAQVARLERQFEEAILLAETALTLLDEQESERAYSHHVLGTVALDRRDWPEAVNFFKRSLRLWEREGNQRMMGRCLISQGAALRQMRKYQEAIASYQQAIDLFSEIGDPFYLAVAQMNLGNIFYFNDQPEDALKRHLQAERVFRRVQDRFYLGLVNHNIGMAYRKLKQWEKAEEAYLLSIEYRRTTENTALLVDTMDGLGLVYLRQGLFEKAKAIFNKALKELAKIEGEPGYQNNLEMVNSHLQEAGGRSY